MKDDKTILSKYVFLMTAADVSSRSDVAFIFLLTIFQNNFIYGSHCGLFRDRKFDVRENHSMKNATKKAAKKAPAKKAAPKKKK